MTPYPNLISDSLLINETIKLLQSNGGRASAVKIVDRVMRIRKPEKNLAKLLVADLVGNDPRLQFDEDFVELASDGNDLRKLAESEFVVVDVETTGATAPPSRITEIGAYRIKDGKISDAFQSLVNPETPIPEFITRLTGINDEMVKDAPKFCEIANEFLQFLGDAVIVAHNAPFDVGFLNYEISRVYEGYRLGNPHLCTVQLSRKLVPAIENHKLHTVAEHFAIEIENRHRASDDAHATARIFVNLLEQMETLQVFDLAAARRIKRISA
jgi:DNA polymerase III epsilon subunit family exonuclease